MHILLIVKNINYYNRGGAARHSVELTRSLRKLGCRVTVLCMDSWENRVMNFEDTIYIPSVKNQPLDLLSFNVNILHKIKNMNINLIHSQAGHGFISALRTSLPLVATAHGSPKLVLNATPRFKYHLSPYVNLIADIYTFKSADKVIAVSKDIKDFLEIDYGIKRKKIEIIANGVDIDKFSPYINGLAVREIYDAYSSPLMVCVTRIGHDRFVNELISAMKIISKEVHDVKLLIVGEGPVMGDLRNNIEKEELSEKIFLVGAKNDRELPLYYAAADIVVSPMVYTPAIKELVVLETMASGKPFVGIDRTMNKRIVTSNNLNKNPLVVGNNQDFVDAVVYFLNNEKHKRMLGLRGRKIVKENYSWQIASLKTLKLYKSLLK